MLKEIQEIDHGELYYYNQENVDHEEFILGQIKDDGIINQIIEGKIQRP